MAAVNMKKNPLERRNFFKFMADLWLEEDMLLQEPTLFNLTSEQYFAQIRNSAELKYIPKGNFLPHCAV